MMATVRLMVASGTVAPFEFQIENYTDKINAPSFRAARSYALRSYAKRALGKPTDAAAQAWVNQNPNMVVHLQLAPSVRAEVGQFYKQEAIDGLALSESQRRRYDFLNALLKEEQKQGQAKWNANAR